MEVKKIINGSIKLKSGCSIKRFTTNGLAMDDGTELQVDVVIFATEYVLCSTAEAKPCDSYAALATLHDSVSLVCGKKAAQKVGPVLGIDDECELRSVWKYSHGGHGGLGIAAVGEAH